MVAPMPSCPCCGSRTGCVTCPVCYWTDDRRTDPGSFPNGTMTLEEARLNVAIYGASAPRYQRLVRPPRPDELSE